MNAYRNPNRRHAALLWILTAAFGARVAGQLVALLWAPAFLPPFEVWSSGAIPYPLLLALQVLILLFQVAVVAAIQKGSGPFSRSFPVLGHRLRVLSRVYFGLMIARYVLTMAFVPELRWLGHAIPIAFHFVLAGWLNVFARHLEGEREDSGRGLERWPLPAELG